MKGGAAVGAGFRREETTTHDGTGPQGFGASQAVNSLVVVTMSQSTPPPTPTKKRTAESIEHARTLPLWVDSLTGDGFPPMSAAYHDPH